MIKKTYLIIFSLLILFFSACQKQGEDVKIDTSNQKDAEKIKFTKMGEVYFQDSLKTLKKKIDVEIADNDEKRHLGLMYRENMKEEEGMLFIFPQEEPQGFYMRNTIISLDIIFINSKKKIVKIHKKTEPFSEKDLPSGKPTLFVVEVNAGFTDKFGIKEGDYIDWRRN
jgi:uncharacterized membrane protein (UPF0127 family)